MTNNLILNNDENKTSQVISLLEHSLSKQSSGKRYFSEMSLGQAPHKSLPRATVQLSKDHRKNRALNKISLNWFKIINFYIINFVL